MIPISITLEGFLSYKDKQTLDFSDSTVWMLTGKNGAGKSTVFDAMRYALYGDQDRGKNEDLIHHDCDACSVSFVFEALGKRLRAERRLQRGKSAVCGLYEEGKKEPIEGSNGAVGFASAIQKHVGLSSEAFAWAVLLRQGQAELLLEQLRVTSHNNSKAYELLKQLVNLSAYEEVKKRADARASDITSEAKQAKRLWEVLAPVADEAIEELSHLKATTLHEVEQLTQKNLALGALRTPVGTWAALTQQQTALLEQQEKARVLLDDPEPIRRDAERHRLLTTLLPLCKAETEARIRLSQAVAQREHAQQQLDSLPKISELQALREDITRAQKQLPYLEQRDRADVELKQLEADEKALAQNASRLTPLVEVEARLGEALSAQTILPSLERIAELEKSQAELLARQESVQADLLSTQECLEQEQAQLDQAEGQFKVLSVQLDDARQDVAKYQLENEQALKVLEKREETRGSLECAYCGQAISKEQWEKDFTQAQQEVADAEVRLNVALKELKAIKLTCDGAKIHQQSIATRVAVASKRQTTLQAELHSLTNQIATQISDLQAKRALLPEKNTLTLADAKSWVSELPELQGVAATWKEVQEKGRLLETQIALQRDLRVQALTNLPESPLTLETARVRLQQAPELQTQEEAYRRAEGVLAEALAMEKERLETWHRDKANLPEVPEADMAFQDLEKELATLVDAPSKYSALESAERDSQRIQQELESLQEKISQLPEAARRPVEELEKEITECTAELNLAQKSHGEWEAKHKELANQKAQYSEAQTAMEVAEKKAALWNELKSQLGAPLQNWLLKEAEGHILEYANAYLDVFSQGNLALEVREGSAIPLDLACRNDLTGGKARALQSLSGSQKFRVAVSLALALGQFASQGSQRIQSVIIDEGFGGLDADGQREMSGELRNLAKRLERLIVVSHQETFAEAFEDRYEIQLVEGTSVPRRVIANG